MVNLKSLMKNRPYPYGSSSRSLGSFTFMSNTTLQFDVANTGFVIQELDSVQLLHDIIFYFESDSIVVSFSSITGFL